MLAWIGLEVKVVGLGKPLRRGIPRSADSARNDGFFREESGPPRKALPTNPRPTRNSGVWGTQIEETLPASGRSLKSAEDVFYLVEEGGAPLRGLVVYFQSVVELLHEFALFFG